MEGADFNGNCFCMQLERLKTENLSPLLPLDVNLTDPSLSGLERTLSQLDMICPVCTVNVNLYYISHLILIFAFVTSLGK